MSLGRWIHEKSRKNQEVAKLAGGKSRHKISQQFVDEFVENLQQSCLSISLNRDTTRPSSALVNFHSGFFLPPFSTGQFFASFSLDGFFHAPVVGNTRAREVDWVRHLFA